MSNKHDKDPGLQASAPSSAGFSKALQEANESDHRDAVEKQRLAPSKKQINKDKHALVKDNAKRPSRAARRNANKVKLPVQVQRPKKQQGRNLTKESKDLSPVADYSGNSYFIEPASIDKAGKIRVALPKAQRRPRAPPTPTNMEPMVIKRITDIFVGNDRPFFQPSDRTVQPVNHPVVGNLERCMIVIATQKYISLMDKIDSHIYYTGPDAFLSTIVSTISTVCDREKEWQIMHYSSTQNNFRVPPTHKNITYRHMPVDVEKETVDSIPVTVGPKRMISYLAGAATTSTTYLYRIFRNTEFVDVGYRSPTTMTGRFGFPTAELAWRSHVNSGMQAIELMMSDNFFYIPPFQLREIAIVPVFSVAVGAGKHESMLLGVTMLYVNNSWVYYPSSASGPAKGDDGSKILYQSELYMAKYFQHVKKMEDLTQVREVVLHSPETVKTSEDKTAGKEEEKEPEKKISTEDSNKEGSPSYLSIVSREHAREGDTIIADPKMEIKEGQGSSSTPLEIDGKIYQFPPLPIIKTDSSSALAKKDASVGIKTTCKLSPEIVATLLTNPIGMTPSADQGKERLRQMFEVPNFTQSPSYEKSILKDDDLGSTWYTPEKSTQRLKVLTTHIDTKEPARGGRDDAVLPLPPNMQGPTPSVPKALFVEVGDNWWITRSFHSWMLKILGPREEELSREARIMITTGMAVAALKFRSPVMAIATLLTYFTASYDNIDPIFAAEASTPAALAPDENAHMSALIAITIKANTPMTEEAVSRIASTFARRYVSYSTLVVLPNVIQEWKRQRGAFKVGWTFRQTAVASVCAAATGYYTIGAFGSFLFHQIKDLFDFFERPSQHGISTQITVPGYGRFGCNANIGFAQYTNVFQFYLKEAVKQYGFLNTLTAYSLNLMVPTFAEEFMKDGIATFIAPFLPDSWKGRERVIASTALGLYEANTNPGRGLNRMGTPLDQWAICTFVPLAMHICVGHLPLGKACFAHWAYNVLSTTRTLAEISGPEGLATVYTHPWNFLVANRLSLHMSVTADEVAELMTLPPGTKYNPQRYLFPWTGMLANHLGMFSGFAISAPALSWILRSAPRQRPELSDNRTIDFGSNDIQFATEIKPVCTRRLELPPLRRSTTDVSMREPEIICRPGRGYRCIGPFISTHVPFCFRSCEHNMRRALHSRMGGIPKVFREDDSLEHQKEVDEYIHRHFASSHDIITATIDAEKMARDWDEKTVLEWLTRFPKEKADNMWKTWIEQTQLREGYKSFVKKEKSVLDIEEAADDFYDESEVVETTITFDPRGISVPYEEMRVDSGPWGDALNRSLYENFHGQIYYNPGNTPANTSRWFEDAIVKVQNKTWPWALAVQGDDSLFIYLKDGVLTILCADMSRYDMSQRKAHHDAVDELLMKIGIPPPRCVDQMLRQRRCKVYHTSLGTIKVNDTMASGDFITITYNSLVLKQAFASWDRVDFVDHMTKLGFAVTFKESTLDNMIFVDFLQCRPWLTERGNRVFAPKPGRILARFFWTDKMFSDKKKYLAELKGMVIGLWPMCSHVPIINDLLRNLVELLQDIQPAKVRFEGPEEIQRWFEGSSEEENDHTIDEMSLLYGVDVLDLKLLRERCRCWNFDGRIDNTPWLSETVRKIARVDLE